MIASVINIQLLVTLLENVKTAVEKAIECIMLYVAYNSVLLIITYKYVVSIF